MGSTVIQDLSRFGPARRETLSGADAGRYAREVALRGRENFHVLSRLLPRQLRADVANIYAYCRWADDLADEAGSPARALELLGWWRDELDDCFRGSPRHPVFVALRETVLRHHLPRGPFADLLDAFEQDQRQSRYETWGELLDYCRRSANPVGQLYLMVCGHRDERLMSLSDQTCTALQLVNLWQDVRRDLLDRDRVYVPQDVAGRHGLSASGVEAAVRGADARTEDAFRATLRELVDRTRPLFAAGRALLPLVDPAVRAPIRLFSLGGEALLQRIVRGGYATHRARPRLGPVVKTSLLARAWLTTDTRPPEAPH